IDESRQSAAPPPEPRERILRLTRDVEAAPDEDELQRQQEHEAQQAELFRHDRENEVRRAFGQKLEMCLRAVEPTLAEQVAGPDRYLRLNDVVAGGERIGLRAQKLEHARPLIVVQERPDRGRGGGGR